MLCVKVSWGDKSILQCSRYLLLSPKAFDPFQTYILISIPVLGGKLLGARDDYVNAGGETWAVAMVSQRLGFGDPLIYARY